MPKAYIIAHIRVDDAERFETFKALSAPVIAEYGGRVLARNPAPDHREGALRGTTVLVEFDSMEVARRFYESEGYSAARLVREEAGETDLMLVEGL